jgi:murein L,D-transpeptidase YcbB/YkuD
MTASPADVEDAGGCADSGVIAELELNPVTLARRSPSTDAPRPVAATHAFGLDLNVPAYRLDAYDSGTRILRFTVAVGMPGFRTPRGTYEITSVDWNPWWIPPDREWARNERQTPPGPSNPMGRVKLNFLPLYFLHGTPAVQSLGQAASHGCVRMANEDAIALALRVHAVGTPALDRALLDSLVSDTSFTRLIPLEFPVPIAIRYDLAEVADDTLFLYRDIYSQDRRSELQRAVDALTGAGIDEELVARDQLRKILRSTWRRPLRIPLGDVLNPEHSNTNRTIRR